MAIVTIVYDTGGEQIVSVTSAPYDQLGEALRAKRVGEFVLKGVNALNPFRILGTQAALDVALIHVRRSERLSEEEKLEYRKILLTSDGLTDDVVVQNIEGEFARTHRTVDAPGPPTYPPITRVVDP